MPTKEPRGGASGAAGPGHLVTQWPLRVTRAQTRSLHFSTKALHQERKAPQISAQLPKGDGPTEPRTNTPVSQKDTPSLKPLPWSV